MLVSTSRSAWVAAWATLYNVLKRVDFWHLNNGSTIASAGFQGFGKRGCAMAVLPHPNFIDSATHVVHNG